MIGLVFGVNVACKVKTLYLVCGRCGQYPSHHQALANTFEKEVHQFVLGVSGIFQCTRIPFSSILKWLWLIRLTITTEFTGVAVALTQA